ncbi:MAG: SEC-C domain-containing protein [Acidobacteriia bacterium]|nr:SEC-C domain-containing protein [Terriglobia bacterium]
MSEEQKQKLISASVDVQNPCGSGKKYKKCHARWRACDRTTCRFLNRSRADLIPFAGSL